MNVFSFGQLGKNLWRALEAELLGDSREGQRGEDLAANLEAKIVAPLQILGGIGKSQAIIANSVYIQGRSR